MKQIVFFTLVLFLSLSNAQEQSTPLNTNQKNEASYNELDKLLEGEDEIRQKLMEINKLRAENEMLSKMIEERKSSNSKKLFAKTLSSSNQTTEGIDNLLVDNKDKDKIKELEAKNVEAESNRRNLIQENNDKRRDFAEKQKEMFKNKKELDTRERELEKELRIERAKNEKLKQLEKSNGLN